MEHFGDLQDRSGKPIILHAIAIAKELTGLLSQRVVQTECYHEVYERHPSKWTRLYFERNIWLVVYPIAKQVSVAMWYSGRGRKIPDEIGAIKVPATPLTRALHALWPYVEARLHLLEGADGLTGQFNYRIGGLKYWVKRHIKPVLAVGARTVLALNPSISRARSQVSGRRCRVAVHYFEGVDERRRSDLVTLLKDEIAPERLLVYIDSNDLLTGRPVDRQNTDILDKWGIEWLTLRLGITEKFRWPCWDLLVKVRDRHLGEDPGDEADHTGVPGLIGPWVRRLGLELAEGVLYWDRFSTMFNSAVQCVWEEGDPVNIVQALACERRGDGLLVGKQRSELSVADTFGYYPHDVHFVWNERASAYLRESQSQIDYAVITGHPNDSAFRANRYDSQLSGNELRARGAKYTIALFDNAYGPRSLYSAATIARLYRSFLDWVIEDPDIGLVVKSKNIGPVYQLPEIGPLLDRAEQTGRCIVPDREVGRLPAEAAAVADMAVGVGISTAVVESVISGRRGIMWNASGYEPNDFCGWGDGRVIFNDLEQLVGALKTAAVAGDDVLGNWDSHLYLLDPYRDGRAGERMAYYLKMCLEGFDQGWGRDKTLHFANTRYAERWGADKVVKLTG